jgi:Uri superfamily endonuclease
MAALNVTQAPATVVRDQQRVPSCPGSYVLILQSFRRRCVKIGRLGDLAQQPGFYLYIGSALGPGGVAARVAHHQRLTKKPRWHLDHLRPGVEPVEVWYCCDTRPREQLWTHVINTLSGATVPLAGFGASDTPDVSHLFFFASQPPVRAFFNQLTRTSPMPATLYRTKLLSDRNEPRERCKATKK